MLFGGNVLVVTLPSLVLTLVSDSRNLMWPHIGSSGQNFKLLSIICTSCYSMLMKEYLVWNEVKK